MSEAKSSTARVVVSIFIELNPVDTFEVFTNDIGLWWQPLPQNSFRAGRKGVLQFKTGADGALFETYPGTSDEPYEVGRIKVWEPGSRLQFTFRGGNFAGDEDTEIEVRFDAEDDGTRVKLEHRGWEVIPAGHPVRHGLPDAEFWQMLGAWWATALRHARKHVQTSRKEIR